ARTRPRGARPADRQHGWRRHLPRAAERGELRAPRGAEGPDPAGPRRGRLPRPSVGRGWLDHQAARPAAPAAGRRGGAAGRRVRGRPFGTGDGAVRAGRRGGRLSVARSRFRRTAAAGTTAGRQRVVARPGRAPRSGRGGREFKSPPPDQSGEHESGPGSNTKAPARVAGASSFGPLSAIGAVLSRWNTEAAPAGAASL